MQKTNIVAAIICILFVFLLLAKPNLSGGASRQDYSKYLSPDYTVDNIYRGGSFALSRYQDATGSNLPANPKNDPDFKSEWECEGNLIQCAVRAPREISKNNIMYCYAKKESLDSGIINFLNPYFSRVSYLILFGESDSSYSSVKFSTQILEPEEYPDSYSYVEGLKLVKVEYICSL